MRKLLRALLFCVPLLAAAAPALADYAVPKAQTAPSGSAGGDLGSTYLNPTLLNITHITTGILPVAYGGTGLSAVTNHALYVANGTNAWTPLGPDSSTGKCVLGVTSSAPVFGTCLVNTSFTTGSTTGFSHTWSANNTVETIATISSLAAGDYLFTASVVTTNSAADAAVPAVVLYMSAPDSDRMACRIDVRAEGTAGTSYESCVWTDRITLRSGSSTVTLKGETSSSARVTIPATINGATANGLWYAKLS